MSVPSPASHQYKKASSFERDEENDSANELQFVDDTNTFINNSENGSRRQSEFRGRSDFSECPSKMDPIKSLIVILAVIAGVCVFVHILSSDQNGPIVKGSGVGQTENSNIPIAFQSNSELTVKLSQLNEQQISSLKSNLKNDWIALQQKMRQHEEKTGFGLSSRKLPIASVEAAVDKLAFVKLFASKNSNNGRSFQPSSAYQEELQKLSTREKQQENPQSEVPLCIIYPVVQAYVQDVQSDKLSQKDTLMLHSLKAQFYKNVKIIAVSSFKSNLHEQNIEKMNEIVHFQGLKNNNLLEDIYYAITESCPSNSFVMLIKQNVRSFVSPTVLQLYNRQIQKQSWVSKDKLIYSSGFQIDLQYSRVRLQFEINLTEAFGKGKGLRVDLNSIAEKSSEKNAFSTGQDISVFAVSASRISSLKLEDLRAESENAAFFNEAYFEALLIPTSEMVQPKIEYIEEITHLVGDFQASNAWKEQLHQIQGKASKAVTSKNIESGQESMLNGFDNQGHQIRHIDEEVEKYYFDEEQKDQNDYTEAPSRTSPPRKSEEETVLKDEKVAKESIPQSEYLIKGPNYNFDIKPSLMAKQVNLDSFFGKRKQKQGVWRNQVLDAIQRLEITHNIQYGGQIYVDKAPYDTDLYEKQELINKLIGEQRAYYEKVYKISEFKNNEIGICVVVPSFNNIESGVYLRNLDSIFMQDYRKYHVVYIDDASTDRTTDVVKKYQRARGIPPSKLQIITNKQNRKPVFNIYYAITNHCKMGEVAMILEGDDALIGPNVFNLYNAVYQRDKCAMAYSSYLDIWGNGNQVGLGIGHQVQDEYFRRREIRKINEIPGRYLLSFYVDVFKSIQVDDFKDPNGYFFWFSYDRVLITPLLEISYPRISVVKQIVYEHRRDIAIESLKDWNRESAEILAKKPYQPLKFFPFIEKNKYKYNFDVSFDQMVSQSDFSQFTSQNDDQVEGISRQMMIEAIKKTEVIHNVAFNGTIMPELTSFDDPDNYGAKQRRIEQLLKSDYETLNEKYNIGQYHKNQLPFCIVTPSYNNVKSGLYLRNLDSVFMQDYSNYHVVYIDDASPDHTGDFVNRYLEKKSIPKERIEVIINKENKKALANINFAIHNKCKSGEIVAIIDGDDSFIGRNILSLFNAVYQKNNAAMAYSSFLTIHNNDRTELGFCHDINRDQFEQNTFRNSWDLPGTHLMTFYSDVFKQIKISDLTYENGTFFDYAYDRAIITPILEMSYPRIAIVREITYEYRNDTGINDSPDDWIRVSHLILDKQSYGHLKQFSFIEGFAVESDQFNFKESIESMIKGTDFVQIYGSEIGQPSDPITRKHLNGITKEQHIHAIRLTQVVHNVNFQGDVDVSPSVTKKQKPEARRKKTQRLEKLLQSDIQYLEAKYSLSSFTNHNPLKFCVVIPSSPLVSASTISKGLYLRNLDSIFMQDYPQSHYHAVYVDDTTPPIESQQQQSSAQAQVHSSIPTKSTVTKHIEKYVQENEIPAQNLKLLTRTTPIAWYELGGVYHAVHQECALDEVVVVVNANDALVGRNVFSTLNALYKQQKSKISYGCALNIIGQNRTQLGTCEQIDEFYFKTNTLRNKIFPQKFHLMSFYAHLFRRIKVQDITFENGTFYSMAADKAIMIPLLEMAYPHVLQLKQVMYEYRKDILMSGGRGDSSLLTMEDTIVRQILSKKPYRRVETDQKHLQLEGSETEKRV